TFQINGVDYYTSGNIDYANTWGEWVKKGFVFKTGAGQTSLTISIKNNAPGGGGNDWAMDDIAFATCLPALEMWPTNTPTYCLNNQADISVAVSTYFDNYTYYQWERSTDGGTNWIPAPELPGIQTFSFTNFSGEYRDTVYLPSFIADTSYNGYKYRVRVATTITNLSSGACAVYNSVDMITLGVLDTCHNLSIGIEDFRARVMNKKTNLQWKAIAEKGNYRFDIERSDDGISFLTIGRIDGTTSVWQNYSFADPEFISSRKYYRVRLTALDGTEKISSIVVIEQEEKQSFMISSVINPFDSKISFTIAMPQNEQIEWQLKDMTGRLVKREKINVLKGSSTIVLPGINNIQTGAYILQVKSSYGIINKVLQKL
ncbi:MAG: T9SS type A sorting domain-containing protein, partial [Lacibacter sp.]